MHIRIQLILKTCGNVIIIIQNSISNEACTNINVAVTTGKIQHLLSSIQTHNHTFQFDTAKIAYVEYKTINEFY